MVVCRAGSAGWKEGEFFVTLLLLLFVFSLFFFLFSFACSPSWRPLPPLERARSHAAAIVLSGDDAFLPNAPHLLLTGGWDGRSFRGTSNVSLLSLGRDGDAPRWILLAAMHHARYEHGFALFAGRIVVVSRWGCDSSSYFIIIFRFEQLFLCYSVHAFLQHAL